MWFIKYCITGGLCKGKYLQMENSVIYLQEKFPKMLVNSYTFVAHIHSMKRQLEYKTLETFLQEFPTTRYNKNIWKTLHCNISLINKVYGNILLRMNGYNYYNKCLHFACDKNQEISQDYHS